MRKFAPWLVIVSLVLSSTACRLGFNFNSFQEPTPALPPVATETVSEICPQPQPYLL
jgi:hypothetical protein